MAERSTVSGLYQANKLEVPHNLFSAQERERRWNRIRLAMKEEGLSCLLVDGVGHGVPGPSYVRYVTNSGFANCYVIFPAEGEVTEVVGLRAAVEWIRKVSWAEDIRVGAWAHPKLTWANVIAAKVKELGYENENIGIVGSPSAFYTGWIAHGTYIALQDELPKAKLVAATKLIDDIKIIKSDEEVNMIRKAAEIADKAIEVMAEHAVPGVKESSIYARMVGKMLEEGGEIPQIFLMSSGPNVKQAASYPQHRMLRKGDIILTELFTRYGGYHAHPQQPVAVGEMSPQYELFLEACLESIAEGLRVLRPGRTFGDVTEAMGKPILGRGLYHDHPAYHGVGICQIENPVSIFEGGLEGSKAYKEELLQPLRQVQVQPNMVVALEPMAGSGPKALHIGPTILTTENEPEILTRYGRDIIRV